MPTYKTPDVYVEEIPVFPPSVAEVETAVPAFIGYTEKAKSPEGEDLLLVPTKIYSLKDYETLFGYPNEETIKVVLHAIKDANGDVTDYEVVSVTEPALGYLLYYAVQMYFANGGGQCYIVSAGGYTDNVALKSANDSKGLQIALDQVSLEDEPTLLVIPEAVLVGYADYKTLAQAMLNQCGKLGDRFAILDVYDGNLTLDENVLVAPNTNKKLIEANRDAWGENLKYGAAYYPFLTTTMNYWVFEDTDTSKSNVTVKVDNAAAADLMSFQTTETRIYNVAKSALRDHYVTMPPSGAVTGAYAQTDTTRGVWKAPANVALANVLEPVVKLDTARQDDLNVDATSGKSINAIRAFAGKGTRVWGARTLAGNDNEWRYVSVRRLFNMVEESVKKSTYWAVFETNDANTWVKVRGMIENYLTQKWREGALAGATTKEAFFVKCGLGTTMTAQDILEGRMYVEIGMAVVRPAEFIILRFFHKLQTS
jgi:phage tail sheath protein FI